MNRRGQALLLLMVVITALVAGAMVFQSRLSMSRQQDRRERLRTQALWLARSAVTTGQTGSRGVSTAAGPATVAIAFSNGRTVALVHLDGATATVSAERHGDHFEKWEERYDAP